jgi:hypothetical protein
MNGVLSHLTLGLGVMGLAWIVGMFVVALDGGSHTSTKLDIVAQGASWAIVFLGFVLFIVSVALALGMFLTLPIWGTI